MNTFTTKIAVAKLTTEKTSFRVNWEDNLAKQQGVRLENYHHHCDQK